MEFVTTAVLVRKCSPTSSHMRLQRRHAIASPTDARSWPAVLMQAEWHTGEP